MDLLFARTHKDLSRSSSRVHSSATTSGRWTVATVGRAVFGELLSITFHLAGLNIATPMRIPDHYPKWHPANTWRILLRTIYQDLMESSYMVAFIAYIDNNILNSSMY